jgi:hypothetical protein
MLNHKPTCIKPVVEDLASEYVLIRGQLPFHVLQVNETKTYPANAPAELVPL